MQIMGYLKEMAVVGVCALGYFLLKTQSSIERQYDTSINDLKPKPAVRRHMPEKRIPIKSARTGEDMESYIFMRDSNGDGKISDFECEMVHDSRTDPIRFLKTRENPESYIRDVPEDMILEMEIEDIYGTFADWRVYVKNYPYFVYFPRTRSNLLQDKRASEL